MIFLWDSLMMIVYAIIGLALGGLVAVVEQSLLYPKRWWYDEDSRQGV